MRKRLFIFAAATCFALSAFATPAFAEGPSLPDEQTTSSEALVQSDGNSNGNSNENSNGNSNGNSNENSDGNAKKDAPPSGSDDGLPNGSDDGPTDDSSTVGGEQEKDNGNATPGASHDPVVGGSAGSAMTLAGTIAGQNVQAWIDTKPAASTGSATFTLNDDFTTDQGLLFTGDPNTPANSRQTFIIDAQSHNITLNGYGIGATYCNVIIKNCNTLTIKAHNHKVPGVFVSACYFGHATLTLDNCTNVTIENDLEKGQGGSGISVYDEGSLYFENKTNVTISGYMAYDCSGIYMDRNDYDEIMGQIVVSNNSTLTATECYHNGITANPVNITVKGNSKIDVNHNNDGWAGYGGLGCYYGTLTVSDHSLVTAYNNTAWQFAVFVDGLDIDGTSKVNVTDNGNYPYGGTGIAIGGNGILRSGAELTSSGNWGPGVQVYSVLDDEGNFYDGGTLTVESGAMLSSCKNYNYGLANGYNLNIKSGAHVYLKENLFGGLDNYPYATTTADAGADLAITNNYGRGIKNGNSDPERFANKSSAVAKLNLNAGLITENNTGRASMPSSIVDLRRQDDYGGGIYNQYGSVSLFTTAKVYNNHAKVAGDDLYNANTQGNSFNIIALEPGAKWSVLDDDGKIIDDWYHDAEGEDKRWKETNAINNTDTDLLPGAALKAAHGINAPTPSPKPVEPTAAPTEAPTPTVAPTAAPTTAPTAAPADNTATAAPATPAPTAQPTVTATPAPTAQASGVIPQTGDSSSPALFSILTLGSITALCVLQKRRKSK